MYKQIFEKGHNSFKAQQLFMGDNPNWFQVHQLKTVRGVVFIRIWYICISKCLKKVH